MSSPTLFHSRRQGWLGVHSLDHFSLIVPDLNEAEKYYVNFGLDVKHTHLGLEAGAFGNDQVWLKLKSGPAKLLDYISFGAFEDDLPRFAEKLKEHNIPIIQNEHNKNNSLWFRDPMGMMIEIKAAPKVMPDEKKIHKIVSSPPGTRAASMRGEAPKIHPARMTHALFFTPDIKKTVEFYSDVIGLKISDFPGPVAFLHGAHGSDHHLIAFAQSETGIGYHHSAWDVNSVEEVGLGASQMAEAGYKKGWGLGRHVLGSNYFHYVRDPWGSFTEYSYDIDYVPVEKDWPASYPSPENSLYLWGPDVPDDFIINHEKHENISL